jgi:hypothetical protein
MEEEKDYDKCGTYAGFNQHNRDRTRMCEACRAAATEYQRNRRKNNPEIYQKEAEMTKLRSRALWRLAHNHQREFQVLLDEEVEKDRRGSS